jgi:hypothetical protein
VERLSARERERVAELVAEGAPFWRLVQEVPRSRYAIYRAVKRLKRPPAREPIRSPARSQFLDLVFDSLVDRLALDVDTTRLAIGGVSDGAS